MTVALDTVSAATFADLLGDGFALRGPGGQELAVTLASCRESPHSTMAGSPRTAFSLVFGCPAAAAGPFRGGDCVLTHPALGEIGPLYVERIMPTGVPPDSAAYQAVFN